MIARILRQRFLKEGQDYLQNQPLEAKKIEKVGQFLNDLSAHRPGNTPEKRKRQATLTKLTLHLEQELNHLVAEKKRLLKITDALRILKIQYEVEAVITETEREIFVNYIKFNMIRMNKLNQAIRQREQFITQIQKIQRDSERSAGWWYLLGGGIITISIFWLYWANLPDHSF